MLLISSRHINEFGNIVGYELITRQAVDETSTKIATKGSTIIITRVSVGKFAFADDDYALNQDLTALVSKDYSQVCSAFLRIAARQIANIVERSAEGIGVRGVTRKFLSEIKIPLPPLKIQQEIVAEIEGYQKIINANKELITLFEQKIKDKIASVWGE